jgi:ABC-2 type transport system ATP-binding protein
MLADPVIGVRGLTKAFRRHTAVEDLTFDVLPGRVTGFLGPNGAGKTTTMRMILGLARPTAGTASVLGSSFAELREPATTVGVLLDAATFHPRRTARNHLRWVAAAAGVDRQRIGEVLEEVDLAGAADRRVGEFSLGMRQRLGLAGALLGRPQLLVLDEPANGLDPAGIRWLRDFLRSFAASGGSVFLSSHLLAEISQLADEVVVINLGRLVTHTSVEDLTGGATTATSVRTPDAERFGRVLAEAGAEVRTEGDRLIVQGMNPERVGEIASGAGVVLHELVAATRSLEEAFFELTLGDSTRAEG